MRGIAHRLTRNVTNPKPDKRSHDWDCAKEWKEGEIFYVRPARDGRGESIDRGGVNSVHNKYKSVESARYDALRPALEQLSNAAKDVQIVIREMDYGESSVPEMMLTGLVRSGKVTLAELAEAYEAEQKHEDDEYNAQQAARGQKEE